MVNDGLTMELPILLSLSRGSIESPSFVTSSLGVSI